MSGRRRKIAFQAVSDDEHLARRLHRELRSW
jgi:hypothetical protein